jgi:acyl carrier protein
MIDRIDIKTVVLEVLQAMIPSAPIREGDRLIDDLQFDSDDATSAALALERRFKIRVPRSEWSQVYTVKDIIDLFERHSPSSES